MARKFRSAHAERLMCTHHGVHTSVMDDDSLSGTDRPVIATRIACGGAQPVSNPTRSRAMLVPFLVVALVAVVQLWFGETAAAQDLDLVPDGVAVSDTPDPVSDDAADADGAVVAPPPDAIPDLTVTVDDGEGGSSQPLTIVLVISVLALAPALLIMLTAFTRIIIVLGITRNALSLQGIPPNQVLIGLSLFLTIFVMAPVLNEANDVALQPLLDDEISQTEAFELGLEPFRTFMLEQVREADLEMFVDLADDDPATPDDVSLTTLIPAYVLSELRAGFIIGFLVFVPFLVIDIVVSATLMSMGMVMLPPVVISLPFKLLLFVIADGWSLLVPTLVTSFAV